MIPFKYSVRALVRWRSLHEWAGCQGGVQTPRMSQLPEQSSLFNSPPPAPTPGAAQRLAPELPPAPRHAQRSTPQRIPRWLVRAELFLRVMLRIFIGQWVFFAPWSHRIWDQNPLFLHFPTLGMVATNGAVRGLVSGVGLLNLWIAFFDAFRHRDE